jgi:hypothetical protein
MNESGSPLRARRSIVLPWLFAAVAGIMLSGCAAKTVTIKSLLDDAPRFDGDKVRIVGDVESPMGALGLGTYQVNDGTGTLRVVSQSGGAPRVGAHVGVEGTFRSGFTLGSESAAVLMEDERFTP